MLDSPTSMVASSLEASHTFCAGASAILSGVKLCFVRKIREYCNELLRVCSGMKKVVLCGGDESEVAE